MNEENTRLVHQWFEQVWNEKNTAAIDEMLDAETVHHGLGGTEKATIRGNEEFKNFHAAFVSAFPDLRIEIQDSISEGEKVSIRCVVKGTHRGDGFGIAPTNREVEFTGAGICTIKNGKFVEVWNEFDFLTMYNQLGVLSLNLK